MSAVTPLGSDTPGDKAPLPRLCPLAVVARTYVDRAATPRERNRRVRQLLAFAGSAQWELGQREIAAALRMRNEIGRQMEAVGAELRRLAVELKIDLSYLFAPPDESAAFDAA